MKCCLFLGPLRFPWLWRVLHHRHHGQAFQVIWRIFLSYSVVENIGFFIRTDTDPLIFSAPGWAGSRPTPSWWSASSMFNYTSLLYFTHSRVFPLYIQRWLRWSAFKQGSGQRYILDLIGLEYVCFFKILLLKLVLHEVACANDNRILSRSYGVFTLFL